jgi:hypothetical protein
VQACQVHLNYLDMHVCYAKQATRIIRQIHHDRLVAVSNGHNVMGSAHNLCKERGDEGGDMRERRGRGGGRGGWDRREKTTISKAPMYIQLAPSPNKSVAVPRHWRCPRSGQGQVDPGRVRKVEGEEVVETRI